MTTGPLDELYFQWLYHEVAPLKVRNPARTYWALLTQLHQTEFTWFVPNDDNRVADGKYLRYEFLDTRPPHEHLADHEWIEERGCSMLEMLVALSRRCSFLGGGAASAWFWHLIDNLGMRGFTDAKPGDPAEIDHILRRVIDRTYDEFGNGGLFPLRETDIDQRQVEIWHQMNHYLIERG